MRSRTRILFLSANPWTTSRILVDEEAREISEKLQQGAYRDRFELQNHAATRVVDLQRLLMTYKPNIVHFSVHGSKNHKLLLGGTPGRGREVDRSGLVDLFALYRKHVRLVFLNACFTQIQAQSLCGVIDYSVGTEKMIGDKNGVAFAGAFYRALSFGKSVREAFQSARVELGLTKMRRSIALELFMRDGLRRDDSFPKTRTRGDRQRPVRQAKARTSSVGSVRAEAIVSQRRSGASLQARLTRASKAIRKADDTKRGTGRLSGKGLSPTSLLPASATATFRVLRVVRTESFEVVVNTFEKE